MIEWLKTDLAADCSSQALFGDDLLVDNFSF